MAKYRKKPVVIDAFQMTKPRRWDNSCWPTWLHVAWNKSPAETGCVFCVDDAGLIGPGANLCVTTLEGTLAIAFDDWIIKGVNDELYPCKPDIFEQTYEPVTD